MGIQPAVLSDGGSLSGVYARIADLNRRLSVAETKRGIAVEVNGARISPGSITTPSIAAGTITANLIQSDAIETRHLQADAVKAGKIAADVITSREIQALAIATAHLQAGSITVTKLAAGSVDAEKIQALAITTDKLQAGAVTAEKIGVASLSAITSVMGNITSGTITGGTIRSGTTGARWEGTPTALRGYALDGVTKTFEIDVGSGVASFTGIAQLDSSSVVPGGTISGKIPGAAVPAVGGANALLNSSFENATTPTDGWSLYNNGLSPAPTFAVVTLTDAYDGGSVARLTNGTDTTGQMGFNASTTNRPKVRAGRSYTLSAYGMSSGAAGNFRVHIHWLDSGGAIIGGGNASTLVATTSNTWGRATVTAAAPTNAVNALCYAWADNPSSGLVFYFDAIQFEEGEVATAYAPRPEEILPGSIKEPAIAAGAVTTEKMTANTINGDRISTNSLNADRIVSNSIQTLQLAAGSVKANTIDAGAITAQKIGFVWGGNNRAPNFSAEAPISGTWGGSEMSGYWFNTGGTVARVTTDAYDGGACVETSASGSLAYQGGTNYHTDMAYKSGVKYTASIYAKSVSGTTGFQIFAGLASANNATSNITLTTSWQRFSVTWTPSADVAVGTRVFVGLRTTTAAAAVFRMDAAQIEEGELLSPASRRPGEVLEGEIGPTQITPNSITADRMVAGTITAASGIIADAAITNAKILNVDAAKITTGSLDANRIAAGSITASKLTVSFGGSNMLQNAKFAYWPSGPHPWNYNSYDNGATGTKTWSQVAGGGPNGENSWRLVTSGTNIILGFQTGHTVKILPNVTYVQSWWWKGASQPDVASNTSFQTAEWILNPTPSATTWQRYAKRLRSSGGGGLSGGVDFIYVYVPAGTTDNQIALFQFEQGEHPSAHNTMADELLPNSVGTTQITPGSVTSDSITGNAITGKNFQTSSANPRVAFDSTGFFKTDASGNKAINLGTGSGEGLQLIAFTGNGLHPSNDVYTVNWKNTNGDILANIWGTRGGADIDKGGLYLSARNKVLNGPAAVYMLAYGYNPTNGTTNVAAVECHSNGTSTSRGVWVEAGTGDGVKWVLRGDGYSDFGRRSQVNYPLRLSIAGEDNANVGMTIGNSPQQSYGQITRRTTSVGVWAEAGPGAYAFYSYNQGGTNYGPFTGGHDVRLKGPACDYIKGMILASTGDVAHTPDKADISTTLAQVEPATKANATAVFGVFAGELTNSPEMSGAYYTPKPDERIATINSLGDGLVLVSDLAGEIQHGDYITPSELPGIGERQEDDVLRNSTVAKALEPSNFAGQPVSFTREGSPVKVKLLACTYHCG